MYCKGAGQTEVRTPKQNYYKLQTNVATVFHGKA